MLFVPYLVFRMKRSETTTFPEFSGEAIESNCSLHSEFSHLSMPCYDLPNPESKSKATETTQTDELKYKSDWPKLGIDVSSLHYSHGRLKGK